MKFQSLINLVESKGFSLVASNKSEYKAKTIYLSTEQARKVAVKLQLPFPFVVTCIVLHELGHGLQPINLLKQYKQNPLPAEEDAWDRAVDLFKELFGRRPPKEFYQVRQYALESFYKVYSKG